MIELTDFEKEILSRAFYLVLDYSSWDDLLEDPDNEESYQNIELQIIELAKKLGITF